ncbi:prepilin peptidase [Inquilinus limosus]|uniref:prepilin peptidase n=1 Tax=Inquilinus limosus TaxID=171674 RepID=UPI0004114656|nr:A24 family peptidase [Inquilinus limosus]
MAPPGRRASCDRRGQGVTPIQIALVAVSPIVGSFLAAAAHRLPDDVRGLLVGRSRCDRCLHPLALRDLVPVLSWIGLGGRCRHCGGPIDRTHPVIELAAIGIALLSVLVGDPTLAPGTCLLGWWLLLLGAIDRRIGLLPDMLTLPLILAGLLAALAEPGGPPLADRAIGAAAGYLLFAGVASAYRRLRGKDGLGLGDAKLLAAGGAWLGWQALPWVILIGAGVALLAVLVFARGPVARDTAIAFGPWLALGIWLMRLVGPL